MRYLNPPIAELLAAEYVLGTLKGHARRRFEGLLHAHPALRSQVRAWELRLNQLAEVVPPVSPPATTWDTLQQRLFPASTHVHGLERLNLWRNLALTSSLLAGVLAILLGVSSVSRTPAYLVLINDAASHQPVWIVSTSADMERLYVKNRKPMAMPSDIRCLLWLRPEGSQDYYALGVLPDKGEDMMLEVSREMRSMLPGQLLVTIEDISGPMPDKPSSPPRYQGEWMKLKPI